ncbi:MAG: hypothetical protein PHD76_14970 [Methylacidiphilales bacterium]|nr:hypothetical protein [Candidatus Methylacidiphilales bacterium]
MKEQKSIPPAKQDRQSWAKEAFPGHKIDPVSFAQTRMEMEAKEIAEAPRDKNGNVVPQIWPTD